MTQGSVPVQGCLSETASYCDALVPERSIYSLLHRECHRLFPDPVFADLFSDRGRRSVPPRVVAVVMVLPRLFGLSDREAVERYSFDVRWRWAAGDAEGLTPAFAHTVLVDMRARLAASEQPRRIFEISWEVAREAGLVGERRVLDSTPLYDAVATMDTVTLIRSALRGLLSAADADLEAKLRTVLRRDDDYAGFAKPPCDWDDARAREALVDQLARDAHAALAFLEGQALGPALSEASALLATVVGQDLDEASEGTFHIARRVASDRVISTVDTQARHGHKTSARRFDGYKGHVPIDPDSEIICATLVTPANAGHASVAEELIAELLQTRIAGAKPAAIATTEVAAQPIVWGDAAYGTGVLLAHLEKHGIEVGVKFQPPVNRPGLYRQLEGFRSCRSNAS